ncbi:MAG: hypothetical protein RMK29_07565 [Myxococcales bacterium]|nr:hypothetical protein [Myxococcota bacterium]MDW8281552.1 hypothetical protein [Myxococcales bacterium]
MLFEGRDIGDDGDLAPLLRAEALRPIDMPHGDEGDHRPLHWVRRLLAAHPELTARITDAYLRLLRDPDPRVFIEVLEHLAAYPVYVVPQLYELIAECGSELRRLRDPSRTDGRSLLGTLVETLRNMIHRGPPPKEAAQFLAEVQDPQDGWPTSLLLALPADLPGLVPRLLATLQRLDDNQLARFARGMALYGPPLTEQGLEAIGRGPGPLRDRFAAALRDFFCQPQDVPRLRVLLHRLGIEDS